MRTEAARAAAEIRKELKKFNIKASVTSDNYSMGSSISVTIKNNPLPATVKAVTEFCKKYGYDKGSRIDDSRITDFRDDIPQASFVSVSAEYDQEIREKARELIKHLALPSDFNQDSQVHQMLNGCHPHSPKLWTTHKPRVTAKTPKSISQLH